MSFDKTKLIMCGVALGTIGLHLLTGKTAKKIYTEATAGVLREKKRVMKIYSTAKENCGDILDDAKAINKERYDIEDEVIEDCSSDVSEA